MAATTAANHNPILQEFNQRLQNKGKQGEVHRAAFMKHFGDIDRLRAATSEKLAAELWTFLHP